MAGDWIKLTHSVFEAPEVLNISDALNLPACHVVGCLARIWCWVDQQSADGNALSVNKVTLDRLVGVSGFADAMLSTGWLAGNDRNLSIPKFELHNGNSAKKRAQTASRVATHRKRKSNADSVAKVLPEKRREDINTPLPPKGGDGHKSDRGEKPARTRSVPLNALQALAKAVGIDPPRQGETEEQFRRRYADTRDAMGRVAA